MISIISHKYSKAEFEAWVHGPISPELYSHYKDWGGLVIPQMPYDCSQIEMWIVDFLNVIFDMYKEYSADELEQLTHQEQPWQDARKGYTPAEICRVKIKDITMNAVNSHVNFLAIYIWIAYNRCKGDDDYAKY